MSSSPGLALLTALAATAVLCALPGCRLPRDTAAEVGGRRIPASELEAAVRAFTAPFGQAPPALERDLPRLRRGVLERLIDRELMLAEAGRRGIQPSPAEIERSQPPARQGIPERELEAILAEVGTDRESCRRATERDQVIARFQAALAAEVTVAEREVDAWIAEHREGRDRPEEVRASQILLRTEADALEARRRILGGAPFADVAREASLSPDADRGGDLGFFARGQMPAEFDEAAFALPRGELSGVVESPWGFHLFLVTDRHPARTSSDAEFRDEVRAALLAEKREAAFRSWLASARASTRIRYNRSIVPD
jgi:peptidyl-prolyl cis-trans isomerase C